VEKLFPQRGQREYKYQFAIKIGMTIGKTYGCRNL